MYNASMLNLLYVGIIVSVLIQNTTPPSYHACCSSALAVAVAVAITTGPHHPKLLLNIVS